MNFIFDKDKLKDMHDVISLYKKFDRYKDLTREDEFKFEYETDVLAKEIIPFLEKGICKKTHTFSKKQGNLVG